MTMTWRATEHASSDTTVEYICDRVCSEKLTRRHGRHTLDALIACLDRTLKRDSVCRNVCFEFDFGADTLWKHAMCPPTPVAPPTPIPAPSLVIMGTTYLGSTPFHVTVMALGAMPFPPVTPFNAPA